MVLAKIGETARPLIVAAADARADALEAEFVRRFYAAADLPAFAAAARDLLASTFECDEAELYFDDAPTAADAVAAAFATAAAAAAEGRATAAAEGGRRLAAARPAPPAAAAVASAGRRSSGTMRTGRWCACRRATR